jgi:hypothetical protein
VLLAWFYVHCAACSIKTNSFCTTITQPNVFPAAGKSDGTRAISERNEGMKVFLVDDSAIVLEKLAVMISGIDGVEIAGQALNARDAIQSIVKLKPDVAILDIRLNGGGNGMDVLKRNAL